MYNKILDHHELYKGYIQKLIGLVIMLNIICTKLFHNMAYL
jgi:hypothetical protein